MRESMIPSVKEVVTNDGKSNSDQLSVANFHGILTVDFLRYGIMPFIH